MRLLCIFSMVVRLAAAQGGQAPKYAVAEGKVTSAAGGEPIVRALVTVKPVTQKPGDEETDFPGYATETDEGGAFHFAKVPAGKYDLFVEKPGFLRTNYGAHRAGGPGVPIELAGDQTRSDLQVKMAPEGVISGRVTDDHGEPARTCFVEVLKRGWMNGRSTLVPYQDSQTNGEGNFRVTQVSPGPYYLRADCLLAFRRSGRQPILVDREGNVIRTRQVATYFGDSTTVESASVITVQAGEEVNGENIQVKREAVYRVRGKLVAPAGEAAASYRLFLSPQESGFFFGMTGNAKAKPDGSFEMDNVPAGHYQMHVYRGNHSTWLPTLLDVSGDVQNFVAVVPPPMQLRGRVRVERQAATPLSAMSLHLIGSEGMFGSSADVAADGSLKFGDVTPDQYELNLDFPGETAFVKSVRVGDREMPGKTVAVAFEIAEKESKQIQFKLIPAEELNQVLERLGL